MSRVGCLFHRGHDVDVERKFWSFYIAARFSRQMPEMLHNDAGDHGFSHCGFFLLQNAGILLGFCIMLLIAVFEHHIRLDLGD